MDIWLTRNFHLDEFLRSETATRLGCEIIPSEAIIDNLRRLCLEVLQPLRDDLGRPIVVSSGYRPKWLNEAIGGSRTSAHMDGRAADLRVPGMSPTEVCVRIHELALPVDQCIDEFPALHGWVHVGIAQHGQPRRQFLTARKQGRRTVYDTGICHAGERLV